MNNCNVWTLVSHSDYRDQLNILFYFDKILLTEVSQRYSAKRSINNQFAWWKFLSTSIRSPPTCYGSFFSYSFVFIIFLKRIYVTGWLNSLEFVSFTNLRIVFTCMHIKPQSIRMSGSNYCANYLFKFTALFFLTFIDLVLFVSKNLAWSYLDFNSNFWCRRHSIHHILKF